MRRRISVQLREMLREAVDPTTAPTKQITLRLREGLVDDVDRLAREGQTSRTNIIETILETVIYDQGGSD